MATQILKQGEESSGRWNRACGGRRVLCRIQWRRQAVRKWQLSRFLKVVRSSFQAGENKLGVFGNSKEVLVA